MGHLRADILLVEITNFCNLDCIHCLRGESRDKYINQETVDNIFKDLASIKTLVISGGEPLFALNQLNMISEAIYNYNIVVDNIRIITNGTVLYNDIIFALLKLDRLCHKLEISISNDKFHQMSQERKGLTQIRKANYFDFRDLFNARYYASPGNYIQNFQGVGRARYITEDELNVVNKWGYINTNYKIKKYEANRRNDIINAYINGNNIIGVLNINVDGYLIDNWVSYCDCDRYSTDDVNVNKVGLYNAINNFKSYYDEVEKEYLNKERILSKNKNTNNC